MAVAAELHILLRAFNLWQVSTPGRGMYRHTVKVALRSLVPCSDFHKTNMHKNWLEGHFHLNLSTVLENSKTIPVQCLFRQTGLQIDHKIVRLQGAFKMYLTLHWTITGPCWLYCFLIMLRCRLLGDSSCVCVCRRVVFDEWMFSSLLYYKDWRGWFQ